MRLTKEVLRPFLSRFIVVYLDDILMYSTDEESHLQHLRELFEVLRKQAIWEYGEVHVHVM